MYYGSIDLTQEQKKKKDIIAKLRKFEINWT